MSVSSDQDKDILNSSDAPAPQSLHPTVSIAMCTFNGERFVREQLESLALQTRIPDELIICDDCSTDGTVEIAAAFSAEAPFPVHIHQNDTNLGVQKNFEQAISLCRGDLIALCDQDDVWHREKLEKSAAALLAEPDIGLVFSDADIVDEDFRPLGYRLWETVHLDAALKRRIREGRVLEDLLTSYLVTGATMVFRSQFRDLVLPIPSGTSHMHDRWIATLIAAVARVTIVDEPLMRYRQHSTQAVGAHRTMNGDWPASAGPRDPSSVKRKLEFLYEVDRTISQWPTTVPAYQTELAASYHHLARSLYDVDRRTYNELSKRALALAPNFRPRGSWRYQVGRRLVGPTTVEWLASVKRRTVRMKQRRSRPDQ